MGDIKRTSKRISIATTKKERRTMLLKEIIERTMGINIIKEVDITHIEEEETEANKKVSKLSRLSVKI